jgi:hypothetical protein
MLSPSLSLPVWNSTVQAACADQRLSSNDSATPSSQQLRLQAIEHLVCSTLSFSNRLVFPSPETWMRARTQRDSGTCIEICNQDWKAHIHDEDKCVGGIAVKHRQ